MPKRLRNRRRCDDLTVEEVAMLCPACAEEMRRRGWTRVSERVLFEELMPNPSIGGSLGSLRRLLNG